MRIAILSRNPYSYSTKRLYEACRNRGHVTRILDVLNFRICIESKNPTLFYKEKPLRPFDALIPRVGASVTSFGLAVVRQFEQIGVFSLNSSHAISIARDKLRSIQVLSRHEVGIPATAFVREQSSVMQAIEDVGGVPVVIKLLEGTQGIGVMLAEHPKIAESIVETLQSKQLDVLIQKFVQESHGRDIRAFVVGNQVIAAMRRTAVGDEFRSNVHRGGSTQAVQLEPEYERMAIQAAQILGLHVAGVDMLESKEGPKIMEVNSSPGLEGIEAATKVDIADAIVAFLERQVSFPEIDIRQRLTLAKDFGVVECEIFKGSPLIGQTLANLSCESFNILVLSLVREQLIIPTPRVSEQLLSGDKVLCYGHLTRLQELLALAGHPRAKKPKTPSSG